MEKEIPALKPSEFDEYIFDNWKPEVSGFYDSFHIERIENYRQHLKLPLQPHRRSVYFFLYVLEGRAKRSKGLTVFDITPNSFFCLPADQITSLTYVSEDIKGYYCHFLPEIFNHSLLKTSLVKDFDFFKITGNPLVAVKNSNRFVSLLHVLEEEYRLNDKSRFDLIPIYLTSLFKELELQNINLSSNKNIAAQVLTERYKEKLVENIKSLKSVSDYAELLSVSPNHLHKCVKKVTGKTAQMLLNDMRILEAKVLLKQSHLSIAEIAFRVGKSDPSDFSRFFKSHTEITPKQYRISNT
jgi:AraC family transcriptional regulator, transcriptional activator of pobA